MRITPDDLFIAFNPVRVMSLMEHWSWFLDEPPDEIVAVTVLGDVFYKSEGWVCFLKTSEVPEGTGLVGNPREFQKAKTTQKFCEAYLCPQLVEKLLSIHGVLPAGQCFSRIDIMGSEDNPKNYAATDLGLHLTVTGVMSELKENVPDDEEVDWDTATNERRRFAEVLREAYPRILAEVRNETER